MYWAFSIQRGVYWVLREMYNGQSDICVLGRVVCIGQSEGCILGSQKPVNWAARGMYIGQTEACVLGSHRPVYWAVRG